MFSKENGLLVGFLKHKGVASTDGNEQSSEAEGESSFKSGFQRE